MLRSADRYEEAEAIVRRGLEAIPGDPELTCGLAGLLRVAHQDLEAKRLLKSVVETSGGNALAYSMLAQMDAADGDWASAKRRCEQTRNIAILEKAEDISALITAGTVLAAIPQQRGTAEVYLQAAASAPLQDYLVHVILGLLREQDGDESAEAHFKKARKLWDGAGSDFERAVEDHRAGLVAWLDAGPE